MTTPTLHWLPEASDWRPRLAAFRGAPAWEAGVGLAQLRLDFLKTNALDDAVQTGFAEPPAGLGSRPVRLAILGSSTVSHLHAAIRVAGLRRGLHVATYDCEYGQYLQELMDPESGLYRFRPTAVLLALDGYHLAAGLDGGASAAEAGAALEEVAARMRQCWALAKGFGGLVLQQTVLPVWPELMGSNEHRLAGSRAGFLARLNGRLRDLAEADGVALVAVDARAAQDGLGGWHDAAMWHRSKQEIAPAAAPVYGELVARVLAAGQGRSAKCLVLDLDNTIWGGVVGDDGVEGLVLGQGSALGEGFVAVQDYARALARRGVILAVCSKNDEANALEPFETHPEMVLRRADIASFVANWSDKASNIRAIAAELNIGLDSLVFVDDNPFERNLVRTELPMVAVPEVPDDPALVPRCLADAGYFEALAVTEDDRARTGQYRANRDRETLRGQATDMDGYLRGLEMRLTWRRFDRVGLQRTVQLINKTNQFNLTTRRYTEAEVLAVMADARCFGLQLRLLDRFGDNGIIGIVIGRMVGEALEVDTWLMSCRVLGRQVEPTTLNLVVAQARALGAARVVGRYRPTAKNAMVREHFSKLGFATEAADADGATRSVLELAGFEPAPTFIDVMEG